MAKGNKKGKAAKNAKAPAPAPEPAPEPEPAPAPEPEPEPEPAEAERARGSRAEASASAADGKDTRQEAPDADSTTTQRGSRGKGSRVEEDHASDDYESMTPQRRKEECRRAGLSPDGLKEELVRRLREAQQTAALGDEADADKGSGDQDDTQDHEAVTRDGTAAEEGDPPVAASATEGSIAAQMELDTAIPESEVARGALKADFIRDLAERLGVDPSRINVTAIEEAEAE